MGQKSRLYPVSLGPIVLRAETAAIYSLSVLAYELQGQEAVEQAEYTCPDKRCRTSALFPCQ